MSEENQNQPSQENNQVKKNTNMKALLKNAIPILKMSGINLDEILQDSLKFLPKFFQEKIEKYQAEDPDLRISIMITSHENDAGENELWLVPVGTEKNIIKKEYEPFNLNAFLSQISIEELLKKDQ